MSVKIVVDDQSLKDVEQRLGQFPDKAPNAIANALNRSVSNISSNIVKETRKNYHIKATDVKSTLKTFKASRSKLSVEVKSQGKVLGLNKFKVSPMTVNPRRKNQLKIAVEKTGMKQIHGAFIANLNGIKVFKGSGKKVIPTKGRYVGRQNSRTKGPLMREEINRLFGPSVPQMIGNEDVVENINHQAWITYEKRLNHEINRILRKI